MADEARLIVELQDRSGAAGAAPSPSQPSNAPIPGSTAAQDIHNQVSAAGAGAKAGAGSSPTSASVPPPAPASIPPATPAPGGDPLINAVRAILSADPNTTAAELQAALGIDANRATTLLQAAQGNAAGPAAPAVSPNTATPPPSTPSPAGGGQQNPPRPPPVPPPVQQAPPPPPPWWQQAAQGAGGFGAVGGTFGGPLGTAAGNLVQTSLNAGSMSPAMAAGAWIAGGIALASAEVGLIVREAERARAQIRDISPDVAAAEARAEIRQLAANMRTSQRLSDEVATYVDRRSRLGTAFQESRDIALEPLLRDLNDTMALVSGALEKLNGSWLGRSGISGAADMAGPPLLDILGKLGDLWERAFGEEKVKADSPLTWLSDNPFLPPPPPFSSDFVFDPSKQGSVPKTFAPIPGLKL